MPTTDDELKQDFVTESQEHLADIESDILAIEAAGAGADIELINKVFRAVHSIKGAAGFLGFTTIGELAHCAESVLNLVRGHELTVTAGVADVLLKAADTLRGLLSNVLVSNDADISEHVRALQAVVTGGVAAEVHERMEQMVTIPAPDGIEFRISEHAILSQERIGHHLYMLDYDLIADVQDAGRTPLEVIQELTALGEIVASRSAWTNCGDLLASPPGELPFYVLYGTVLEADFVPAACGLSSEHVRSIDPKALLCSASETPAPPPISHHDGQAKAMAPAVEFAAQIPVHQANPVSAPEPAHAPPLPSGPAPAVPPSAALHPNTAKPMDTSIRVSVALLDRLMNLAGELVLSRNQLVQAIVHERTEALPTVGVQLDRITSELQESIMQTRMQPIATIFSKFSRVVRDLSNQLGKQCELVLHGQEVELDKSIIEAIGDPLTHLVRNSVDHGIETPDQRAARGKTASGTITLRAFHQAGKINIEIIDDGAGIDVERIRSKAVEKGLLAPDRVKEIGDREALRFIFAAGFSLAKQVTEVSGRGVGMDVVRTNIEKLGGTIDIDTVLGKGTTMRIRLPLTLAIIPSLIVRCGDERFALPQVGISELVRIKSSEVARKIERIKHVEVLRLRGTLLPLVRLSAILNQPSKYLDPGPPVLLDNQREHIVDRRAKSTTSVVRTHVRSGADRREDTAAGALNIIVLESGHLKYGLIVDELFDSEEIVVKPLGRHTKDSACLAGATILGDGSVALILDVSGIASTAQLAMPEADAHAVLDAAYVHDNDTQSILLFTNHPNERFAMPMGLITRIERIRVSQIDHVGGQAVLQYRGTSLPLLALEDCVSADPRPDAERLFVVVFKVSNREVGLIAPQLVDIRQIPREIDTTTFAEPGVLGSVILDDQATRLVDVWALTEKAHPEWFAARPDTKDPEGRAPTLLLAEDSSFFRRQVASFLESEGYRVVACEDGAAAWQTLRESEEPFDLVVTDIEMPNMDGLQLTRHIRGDVRFASIPVIAVTSLAAEADIQRGIEAGVDEYHVKLERDQLTAAISKMLRSRRRQADAAASDSRAGARSHA